MSSVHSARKRMMVELIEAVRHMTTQTVLVSETVAAIAGINSTDLECLDVIEAKGVATAGDLAVATGLTTGAITTVIDRLEQAGYLRREADPDDRRKVRLKVIEERTAPLRALYEPLREKATDLWSRYDEEQLKLVVDFIKECGAIAEEAVVALQPKVPKGRKTASRARPGSALRPPA